MSAPLKVGVVGLGIRGFWLAEMTRAGEATKLVAMADLDPQKLEIAREHFEGVTMYQSGETMANEADIEAVFIGTGDKYHAGNAREAMRAGRHVLVEKPLAQSFADLAEIARLQHETGLTVGTFLELRQGDLWKRVKEIIGSGEIGDVLAARLVDHVGRDRSQFFSRAATRSREGVVSLVVQKGVHALDLLNWFIDSSPRRVHAVGGLRFFGGDRPADLHCRDCPEREDCPHARPHTGGLAKPPITIEHGDDFCVWSEACDVEDVTFANIEYASGAVASYAEVHFAPWYGIHFTIYGSRAQMDVEANHDTGQAWIEITERYTRNQRRERPTRDTGHGGADPALIVDFAEAVREGREPISGLRAGYESAAIGIACRESIDSGQAVDIPDVDEVAREDAQVLF
ncbi:MAG: Gfo/Idh/MocA family protein [Armatimonadota bacterium]